MDTAGYTTMIGVVEAPRKSGNLSNDRGKILRALRTQAKWQAVGEKVRAATAECRDMRLVKEIKGFKATAECANPNIIAAFQEAQYAYMDLVFVAAAARVVGGENVDKGKITEAEYNLQLAELNSREGTEAQSCED